MHQPARQKFGRDPLAVRDSEHYQHEYIHSSVEKWDELIGWDRRVRNEGRFFIDLLRERGKHKILDVATGTGFDSVRLMREVGFQKVVTYGDFKEMYCDDEPDFFVHVAEKTYVEKPGNDE